MNVDRGSALEEWWRELAAGTRTPHTYDELWRAACHEISAREYGPPPPDALLAAIEAETRAVWVRGDIELLRLEAELTSGLGDYKRAAILRARARALEADR